MKYSNLIVKKKEYKYSANICFDLKNEEKLSSFIPNVTTTEILTEYLYGILNNTNVHSRILYGSYGTGKSHLLTVLCALLGHINTTGEAYKDFTEAIRIYNEELVVFLNDNIQSEKPYFVVPVYSEHHDFDKCITYSLKKELEKKNINVCFKSYFQEALELLSKWQKGAESSRRLQDVCAKLSLRLDELVRDLNHYETSAEKKFGEVFSLMTYGATFVSEAGSLIDNLETANDVLKKDYRGIVFVFDEFGRYLEDEGESIRVKSIQDLAEYCDHSDYNNYLILVSHKQLSLYTEKMKKEINEEWKKIEGRFKVTSINAKYDQCLSLISHIIPKSDKWDEFKVRYERELSNLFARAYDFKGFLLPPEERAPFEDGFPLHPITLYALDKLSKKVAQNERTFFTYLASDEENALFDQIEKMDDYQFHFVGLDLIYDYFEANIRSYRFDEVYNIYKKLQLALNKLGMVEDAEVAIKVLKTIAVINIIADTTALSADQNTLKYVIDANDEAIERAIMLLEKLKIIKYMRQYGYYDFLDSSIYDLDSMIEEKTLGINDKMVIQELNENFISFVVYPYRYNLDYHMNRIFVPLFALKQDFNKKNVMRQLPKYYDGILAMILDDTFNLVDYAEEKRMPERSILLVNVNTTNLIQEVKRYIAIKYFYSIRNELKKEDPTVVKELELYLEEQRGIVAEIIRAWKSLALKDIQVIVKGKRIAINNEAMLSEEASGMMYDSFPDTIVVNNDVVNKNTLSGTIRVSRNKVLETIIDKVPFDYPAMSPEHTLYRSVLQKNGFVRSEDIETYNLCPSGENEGQCSGNAVKNEINNYLRRCTRAHRPINELYEILKQPPYGLRDGYIAVILASALKQYENVGLYFHGAERDYSSEELIKALDNPNDYSLYLCNWNNEQTFYISQLEELFEDYLTPAAKNRLRELHVAMNIHFSSIPKVARSTNRYVSDAAKEYRNIMSVTHKDFYKFFFEDLFRLEKDSLTLIQVIQRVKDELDNVLERQTRAVKLILRDKLEVDKELKISQALIEKFENDWAEKQNKLFDYQTTAFVEYIRLLTKERDDDQCARDIARLVSGFDIDYWSDSTEEDFRKKIDEILDKLNEDSSEGSKSDKECQIIVKTAGKESRITAFDDCEISVNGQFMLKKIKATIDNFGQSISHEEKIRILAQLLSEI